MREMPIILSKKICFAKPELNDGQFEITAYSGNEIDYYGGKLVFDITGISGKPSLPILREHARDRIVGYGSIQKAFESLIIVGQFSKVTADAIECKNLADEGYPWQASVGISPGKKTVLMAGETRTVNGKPVTGPAEVWETANLSEVSFVSLGADPNTSVKCSSGLKRYCIEQVCSDAVNYRKLFEAEKERVCGHRRG